MNRKPKTLNEEIDRIKTLFDFDFNYDDIIVEQTNSSDQTFDFSSVYPDNIAFPVKPNSKITSIQGILDTNVLSVELVNFINRLKTKISKGVKVDSIKINSGASSEKASTTPPQGYDQNMVNYSYKDDSGKQDAQAYGKQIKATVDNTTLAKNRANFMSWILKSLIPELKNTNIEINSNLNKKVVNIQVPSSVMVNFKTHPEISKEYIEPKSIYTPSFEKPSVVAGCNKQSKATGSAGAAPKYIADRIKLDMPENYTGNITFKYNSYLIPDRFQLIQIKGGKTNIIQDTNFVSSAKGETFNILQNEVKTLFGGDLKTEGSGEISFKAEAGSQYFIDVIAPFGGTAWGASLGCQSDIKPINWRMAWSDLNMDENKEYTFYTDTKGNFYTQNPDGNLKIYAKGKFTRGNQGPVLQDGEILNTQTGKYNKVAGGRNV